MSLSKFQDLIASVLVDFFPVIHLYAIFVIIHNKSIIKGQMMIPIPPAGRYIIIIMTRVIIQSISTDGIPEHLGELSELLAHFQMEESLWSETFHKMVGGGQ